MPAMPKAAPRFKTEAFVKWFRSATPFIHQWGGATFVIGFGGEVLADGEFQQLTHDINVLVSLEVRVILVHGSRPQIEEQMRQHGVTPRYVAGRRVTDGQALACVKEANGIVRVEMEALLSMELANSPMWGADIRVSSGNFVTAKPVGVVDGVDFMGSDWNISLFHYRNHGADVGRVLVGLQVPERSRAQLRRFLHDLGYDFTDESRNPAYRFFLQ